jgi:hypothetical protein
VDDLSREVGYYWVKRRAPIQGIVQWEVALWTGLSMWALVGTREYALDTDLSALGPRLEKPTESPRLLRATVRLRPEKRSLVKHFMLEMSKSGVEFLGFEDEPAKAQFFTPEIRQEGVPCYPPGA